MRLGHLPVLSFRIEQVPHQIGEPRQSLGLELLKKNCSEKIAMKFSGVQNLCMEIIHPGTLCRLEIVSLADDQLEGLQLRVYSDEQDFVLSFYCRDFEIDDVPIAN